MAAKHSGPVEVLLEPITSLYNMPAMPHPLLSGVPSTTEGYALIGALLPAGIAIACIILHLARLALPKGPRWTRRFAKEPISRQPRSWSRWAVSLLGLSAIGLALSILDIATRSSFQPIWSCEPLPWLLALLLILAARPGKTPKTLLVIFATVLVCDSLSVLLRYSKVKHVHIFFIACLVTDCVTIAVIFCMPMRHPALAKDGVAKPFESPDSRLR
ncbi:uncharacterized protein B0I36DRAFT_421176, partial [Microdochium trichocladiopsis]